MLGAHRKPKSRMSSSNGIHLEIVVALSKKYSKLETNIARRLFVVKALTVTARSAILFNRDDCTVGLGFRETGGKTQHDLF
jgi:hypothetical protein